MTDELKKTTTNNTEKSNINNNTTNNNNTADQEIYEFFDDGVDNFDELNEDYRKNKNLIISSHEDIEINDNTTTNLDPTALADFKDNLHIDHYTKQTQDAYKILALPEMHIHNQVIFETEYQKRETDPANRLLTLKNELNICKGQIDEYTEKFKENSFKINDGVEDAYEDIKTFKSKVDAFIDYGIFNTIKEEEYASQSVSVSENSNVNDINTTYQSLYDKNIRLSKAIVSQVKDIEVSLLNNEDENREVKYELLVSPESQIETLTNKINSLESKISNLEKAIGDWSLVSFYEKIMFFYMKFFFFIFLH